MRMEMVSLRKIEQCAQINWGGGGEGGVSDPFLRSQIISAEAPFTRQKEEI